MRIDGQVNKTSQITNATRADARRPKPTIPHVSVLPRIWGESHRVVPRVLGLRTIPINLFGAVAQGGEPYVGQTTICKAPMLSNSSTRSTGLPGSGRRSSGQSHEEEPGTRTIARMATAGSGLYALCLGLRGVAAGVCRVAQCDISHCSAHTAAEVLLEPLSRQKNLWAGLVRPSVQNAVGCGQTEVRAALS